MFATVNGIRLAYGQRGAHHPTALLLVHGFPLDRHLWDSQLSGVSGLARVIAPDLRGSGRSEAPPGPYSIDQLADDLAALLDQLAVERAIVGGLSMGGYIAFAFWRLHRRRVQALALIDTRAEPDSPEARANRERHTKLVAEHGAAALAREMLPNLLARANLERQPLAGRARALMVRQPPAGLIGDLAAMRERPDSRPILAGIDVPVLVMVGEDDRVTPRAGAQAMAAAIPNAQFATIPRAGHLSPLENPRAVNDELRRFVARVQNA